MRPRGTRVGPCGGLTGVPRPQEPPPSSDPTVGLYLGSYGGPKGGGLFLMSEVQALLDEKVTHF